MPSGTISCAEDCRRWHDLPQSLLKVRTFVLLDPAPIVHLQTEAALLSPHLIGEEGYDQQECQMLERAGLLVLCCRRLHWKGLSSQPSNISPNKRKASFAEISCCSPCGLDIRIQGRP